MTRITLIILAAILTLANAQTRQATTTAPEYTAEQLAYAIANSLDAITVDCPVQLDPIAACYEASDSQDHHKWRLETWVSGFNDVRWAVPWERKESFISRAFVLDNGDAYIVYLVPEASFTTLVYVQYLGKY